MIEKYLCSTHMVDDRHCDSHSRVSGVEAQPEPGKGDGKRDWVRHEERVDDASRLRGAKRDNASAACGDHDRPEGGQRRYSHSVYLQTERRGNVDDRLLGDRRLDSDFGDQIGIPYLREGGCVGGEVYRLRRDDTTHKEDHTEEGRD